MSREFSDRRTLHFLTQFATANRAGLPILRLLKLLQENHNPPEITRVWVAVERAIGKGATLAGALKRQSPPVPFLCAELIGAGEQSGHLDTVLAQLRRYYEMRARLRRAALGATAYPAFVACFGFGVLTLLTVVTASDKWAAFYQMLAYFLVAVGSLLALGYVCTRTTPGRLVLERLVLAVPILGGAVRRLALARFARTLAMMYTSGMPMEVSLDRACAAAANAHITADLRAGAARVAEGERLGEAFGACRHVPPQMREMLTTGELTGTYDDTLNELAAIYEDEASLVLENLPKLLAPVILLFIGGLVVYMYYRFYIKPFIIDPVNSLF